jgi:urea transport system substrate-binding protein
MGHVEPVSVRQFDTTRGSWKSIGLDPRDFDGRRRRKDKMRIGLLVPFSGNDAIWGPSGQYSAVLAAAKINALGGVLGREIELFAADSGGSPDKVVPRVAELLDVHQVEALVGVHMSNVRIAIRNAFGRKVPYVYATQYEGGEKARGLFPIGETPVEQYGDAIRWMIRNQGARRWYLLGNDYVWPRQTHEIVRKLVTDAGGEVLGIDYLPLGGRHHRSMIRRIKAAHPDILFETLVGSDCVTFNQVFGDEELSNSIMRLSGVIEENVLMGIGSEFSENLFGVAGYFNSLQTAENKQFLNEYGAAFGANAPIQGGMSQACYESIVFLASVAESAGSLDVNKLASHGSQFSYFGARGRVQITEDRTVMDCHLMRSSGVEYEPVRSFSMQ